MKPLLFTAAILMLTATVHASSNDGWRFDERFTNTQLAQIDLEREGFKAARVFVRCYGGRQLDAVVIVGPALAGRRTPVRYRLDEDAWQQSTWVTTAGGDGVFAADASAFAKALAGGVTLTFEAQGGDDKMHQVRFPLRGSREPIDKVLSACGQ